MKKETVMQFRISIDKKTMPELYDELDELVGRQKSTRIIALANESLHLKNLHGRMDLHTQEPKESKQENSVVENEDAIDKSALYAFGDALALADET